jgi:Flp pilus assembly protein TadG
MGLDMLTKSVRPSVSANLRKKFSQFKSDESGGAAIFVVFIFFMMIIFGGIAVDVMRFEMRRVTLQGTLDRAALAAANLTQPDDLSPQDVAQNWFDTAGLGNEFTVDYSAPTLTGTASSVARTVSVSAKVRSYNHFMGLLNINWLEGPVVTRASQGIAEIEVILVLDVTGSMGEKADPDDPKSISKIEALKLAAKSFVTTVKGADVKNGVSIGLVPYAPQVNIPKDLREQFTALSDVSSWNFIANQGVPDINCIEIPASTFDTMALPTSTPMSMAAVADIYINNDERAKWPETVVANTTNYAKAADYPPSTRISARFCTGKPDDSATADVDESKDNMLVLPTKNAEPILDAIDRLSAQGTTSIAFGMRWGTALIDQEARSIYTAIGDETVQGRPADNTNKEVRKIIVLMTDGDHVASNHVKDGYKSGPSPIYRGSDGLYAVRFAAGAGDLNDGTRPHATNCSLWPLASDREYFIPHLKRNAVVKRRRTTDPEGYSTGTGASYPPVTNACDPLAWKTTPEWPLLDAAGNPVLDAAGKPVLVLAQQLDWSEVWRYLRLEYVARQLYARSNVNGTSFGTVRDAVRETYFTDTAMDELLQKNCAAARKLADPADPASGVEIFGIAFAAPDNGTEQIKSCASPDDEDTVYFHAPKTNADLIATFAQIAEQLGDLRLTQ